MAEASGAGDDSGLGDGSGAVVAGGKSEAGGGKFESGSGGGSGATSASPLRKEGLELPAGAREATCFFFGSITATAGVKLLDPPSREFDRSVFGLLRWPSFPGAPESLAHSK